METTPSLTSSFEDDSQQQGIPSNEGLIQLSKLAEEQLTLESQKEELEQKLKNIERSLHSVSEEKIPALMQELGIRSFALESGESVTVKPYYRVRLSEGNKEKALNWLREHGHDDIIKTEVKVAFAKGEDQLAKELSEYLANRGYSPEEVANVHPSTLRAEVKKMLETGENVPMDDFGAYVGERTKITK